MQVHNFNYIEVFHSTWNERTMQDTAVHCFKKFIKILSCLQLPFNVVIAIHGAEYLYSDRDPQNFFFIFRCLQWPIWLRFIFAVETDAPELPSIRKLVPTLSEVGLDTLDEMKEWL